MINGRESWVYELIIIIFLCSLLLFPIVNKTFAEYYDNTTILTRLNISNSIPFIENIIVYDNDSWTVGQIILTQGEIDTVWCNATITDYNGWRDIKEVNASFYHNDVSPAVPSDKNYKYFNSSCSIVNLNGTSIKSSCSFPVWFYANNGTWKCNVTVIDGSNISNSSTGAKIIAPLFALDLNTTVIDYGILAPGQNSPGDIDVKITNFGNMNINISVDGFGKNDGDNLSMTCSEGNISITNEKYHINSGRSVGSMINLTDSPIPNGISGLTILQNTNDNGNSSNMTFWKLQIPLPVEGTLKGYCNGTVTFSAIGN